MDDVDSTGDYNDASEDARAYSKPPKGSSRSARGLKGNGSSSKSSRKTSKGGKGSKSGPSSGEISKSKSRLVVSIPVNRGKSSTKKKGGKKGVPSRSGTSAKKKASKKGSDFDVDDGGGSSGEEYTTDLFNSYIGQIGGCIAMGLDASDVLNVDAWNDLTEEEREALRSYLPTGLTVAEQDDVVHRLLDGESLNFGSPRDRVYEEIAAGLTHPRVTRWQQRVSLIERRQHIMNLKDYQNRCVRRVQAWKACRESSDDAMASLIAMGGNVSKPGGPLLARPDLVRETAEAAAEAGLNNWDADRWRRALEFRNQETERYNNPERAYNFHNSWGTSIVGPLKRGPALDGGRPREHFLLRNERPSHVTILCIVRDAASRLPDSRGTRSDICELLRDSQYLRDGASFKDLNTCVSGALDRLHYEKNAPVQFDSESKEWCYLHNDYGPDDFEVPEWVTAKSKRSAGKS